MKSRIISQAVSFSRLVKQAAITRCQKILAWLSKVMRKTKLFNRRKNSSLVVRFQLLLLSWGLFVYILAVGGFWFFSTSVIETTHKHQTAYWI
jgi:hypothetical protein